jgi:hypothetical protein
MSAPPSRNYNRMGNQLKFHHPQYSSPTTNILCLLIGWRGCLLSLLRHVATAKTLTAWPWHCGMPLPAETLGKWREKGYTLTPLATTWWPTWPYSKFQNHPIPKYNIPVNHSTIYYSFTLSVLQKDLRGSDAKLVHVWNYRQL